MIKITSRNLIFHSVILTLGLYSLNSFASTFEYRALILGATSSACIPVPISDPNIFSYTGEPQEVSVPTGANYALVTVTGAGGGSAYNPNGNTKGGNGDAISGQMPVVQGQSLEVLVGQGGTVINGGGGGGGGGFSGIFLGPPSQATALLVAGGGGGGANTNVTNAEENGTSGRFRPNPTLPSLTGGMGFGGGGGYGQGGGLYGASDGKDGIPFGPGGTSTGTWSAVGGFGGGGSSGNAWGGGGGGGGLPGGSGGSGNTSTKASYGGQGGTSFVAPSVSHVTETTGGAGGTDLSAGTNGSASITFYGCSQS